MSAGEDPSVISSTIIALGILTRGGLGKLGLGTSNLTSIGVIVFNAGSLSGGFGSSSTTIGGGGAGGCDCSIGAKPFSKAKSPNVCANGSV
ncbi:MAG: hypothetical protein LBK53_09545 [Heliobacteriaceae bacterium]|nr:hypothetical protein [Heliobacteriaceae bacterium]